MKISSYHLGGIQSDTVETWGYPSSDADRILYISICKEDHIYHKPPIANDIVFPENKILSFYDFVLLSKARKILGNKSKYVYCDVDHEKILDYLEGVDGIVISPDVDIDTAKRIASKAKQQGKIVYYEYDNDCIKFCPARFSCRYLRSHGKLDCIKDRYPDAELNGNVDPADLQDVDIFIIKEK